MTVDERRPAPGGTPPPPGGAATPTDDRVALTTGPRVSADELARLFSPTAPKLPTPQQRAVIEADLAPAAVIAGAGSGKTETMASRVVWLVANGVAPERILGLTFTRKAAAELAERVRSRLAVWRAARRGPGSPPPPLGEPTVLTYASYAGRLVGEHAVRVGAEPVARLLSPAADWQVARDVVARWPGPAPEGFTAPPAAVTALMVLAGRMADHLVDPAQLLAADRALLAWFAALDRGPRVRSDLPKGTDAFLRSLERRLALVPLVETFRAAKRAARARDFADEMELAAALAARPEVQQAERARFGVVLLDEYQDTGHAQVETLRRLFGDAHPVTAVGDPLQSIYGWRGASAGTMSAFATVFRAADGAPAVEHPLSTSWRNDRAVLAVANRIAEPLQRATGAVTLAPRPGAGEGQVLVARPATVVDEAEWVGRRLRAVWDTLPGPRTAAVLVRKRSQIPLLVDSLTATGLEAEVVDLGGLLTVPEVADLHATLQVLADHTAGAALLRLLTGARWRIGVADLQALQRRARDLLQHRTDPRVSPAAEGAPAATETVDPLGEPTSVVEALDDLGPAEAYSPDGFARLSALGLELRRLRARAAAPLPELVADVEHTLGLDVEVAARPLAHGRPDRGRVHLDRFHAEIARFADEVDRASLPGLLAFLAAAEEEENGLGAGEVVVEAERVQVLTVHGAKGLEWDVVAVPGLVDDVFPGGKVDDNWLKRGESLPDPLRGDRDHVPRADLTGVAHRSELGDRMSAYRDALAAARLEEERRLAYVAVTRARRTLLLSGYLWDTTKNVRGPSAYLLDAVALAGGPEAVPGVGVDPGAWVEPEDCPVNPLVDSATAVPWPVDPLGDRRPEVEAGAAAVAAALAARPAERPGTPVGTERGRRWAADADLLLAERAAHRAGAVVEVELPERLSVSALVAAERDPAALARSLRRRMPAEPNPRARRGTAFHAWLEQRWAPQAQVLLDIDELPGAADASVTTTGGEELRALQEAFEASEWARREPHAVEVPFEMLVGGRVVRGRMDAVFDDGPAATPRWRVVDWKTGPVPGPEGRRAAAVQLAAYRLAWADLAGVPAEQVRASFHHVAVGVTLTPDDLPDTEGLRQLVEGQLVEDGRGVVAP